VSRGAGAEERAAFAEALEVPRETMARFDAYAALLAKWQARINLVGRGTLDALWSRHFLDSGQLLPVVRRTWAGKIPGRWLDLGSGAGFPGLVLALLGAGEVHLVESDSRKCAFLRRAIRETGAPAVVLQGRVEALTPFAVDIVTARALAPLERLLGYAAPLLDQGAEAWLLKGRDWEKELTCCRQSWTVACEHYPSRTDSEGMILRVRSLARA